MKLSKTMQRVMDELNKAEYYYKVVGDGDGGMVFHNEKGRLSIGFERTWIYYDGMFGITENTKTLEALEKRGLIKIHEIGGQTSDVIEVIGKQVHEPLKKAVKLNVKRWYPENPNYGVSNMAEYIDPATATIEGVQKWYDENGGIAKYEVTEVGEVELTRWDYRK